MLELVIAGPLALWALYGTVKATRKAEWGLAGVCLCFTIGFTILALGGRP